MSDNPANPKNLLLLFQQPKQPVSSYKYINGSSVEIKLPDEYIDSERFGTLAPRFGPGASATVKVKKLDQLPNLAFAMQLDRDGAFSLFLENHILIASKLIDVLMAPKTIEDLMSLASYIRDRINPYLFQYAFSVVIAHRADTKDLNIPSFLETMPDQFIDPKVVPELAVRAANFDPNLNEPFKVPRQFTASGREEEQVMAYFREDIGVNLHHWHWHLVYPTSSTQISIVNKDRRGELFYYMHAQLISRYNVERMCNGLPCVIPLNNLRVPVPEGKRIWKMQCLSFTFGFWFQHTSRKLFVAPTTGLTRPGLRIRNSR
jgi:tyrosinase